MRSDALHELQPRRVRDHRFYREHSARASLDCETCQKARACADVTDNWALSLFNHESRDGRSNCLVEPRCAVCVREHVDHVSLWGRRPAQASSGVIAVASYSVHVIAKMGVGPVHQCTPVHCRLYLRSLTLRRFGYFG